MKFCNERRPEIVKENPDLTFGAIGKRLGEEWRGLSEAKKAKFKSGSNAASFNQPVRRYRGQAPPDLQAQYRASVMAAAVGRAFTPSKKDTPLDTIFSDIIKRVISTHGEETAKTEEYLAERYSLQRVEINFDDHGGGGKTVVVTIQKPGVSDASRTVFLPSARQQVTTWKQELNQMYKRFQKNGIENKQPHNFIIKIAKEEIQKKCKDYNSDKSAWDASLKVVVLPGNDLKIQFTITYKDNEQIEILHLDTFIPTTERGFQQKFY